jgi:hypothetical protein
MLSLLSFGDMIPNGIGYAGDFFNDFKPYIFIFLGLGIAFFIIEVLLDWIDDKTERKQTGFYSPETRQENRIKMMSNLLTMSEKEYKKRGAKIKKQIKSLDQ